MKKMQMASMIVLILALIIMGINRFFEPWVDWIVRIDGAIMLISLFFLSYSTARQRGNKGRK